MLSTALTANGPDDDQLDRVFRALGDRTRRRMLALLSEGPLKVTDLAAPFSMSLPAAGKHVRVLERAGLVSREIDGRLHHCSLRALPLQEASRWLAYYRQFWDESLEGLATYLEQEEGAG